MVRWREFKGTGYDPDSRTFHAEYDRETSQSLCNVLVRAVAVAEGTPPEELGPLRQWVDVDALENLFAPVSSEMPRDSGRVQFGFEGYRVTVHASGEIAVEDPESSG